VLELGRAENDGTVTLARSANSAAKSQNSASGPLSSTTAKVPGGWLRRQAREIRLVEQLPVGVTLRIALDGHSVRMFQRWRNSA
jgi:hypothetical protein